MNQKSKSRYVPALGFQWFTPFYDLVVRATARERTFKSALIYQANLAGGLKVLDMACGTGTLAICIKMRHAKPGKLVFQSSLTTRFLSVFLMQMHPLTVLYRAFFSTT